MLLQSSVSQSVRHIQRKTLHILLRFVTSILNKAQRALKTDGTLA